MKAMEKRRRKKRCVTQSEFIEYMPIVLRAHKNRREYDNVTNNSNKDAKYDGIEQNRTKLRK